MRTWHQRRGKLVGKLIHRNSRYPHGIPVFISQYSVKKVKMRGEP